MSITGLHYVQQMEVLRQEKIKLGDEMKQLVEQSSEGQQKVYQLMSAINGEIANRHFKEINTELLLPSRINSAITLMENEINRLELGMDMTSTVDTEFDSCVEQLKYSIGEWTRLQNEIRSPIDSSILYTKSLEALTRHKKESFPNADNVTSVDDIPFFEQVNRMNESIQAITTSSELVMDDYAQSYDQALSENVQKVSRGLDAQCSEATRHFEDEREERAELLNNMYSELLAKFLVDTEQSVSKYSNQYAAMSRKLRDETAEDVLVVKAPAARTTWKTEIDSAVLKVLQTQQSGREQEERLDALLLKVLDESKISVLPHGMDDSYLQKLMDKLTDLYLESSDIQFKQLKLTS